MVRISAKFAGLALLQIILLSMGSMVTAAADDRLIHNSANLPTPSSKWGGNWGVPAGKYGAFSCTTCHRAKSANIKRIVTAIPTFIGTSTAVPKPVVFKNTTGFGSDAGGHTTSAKICEVCHSKTVVHNYNTTGQNNLNHMNANNSDCVSCHTHKLAFGSICTTCHGYPPNSTIIGAGGLAKPATNALTYSGQPGAHLAHTDGQTFRMNCETCHSKYTNKPMGNNKLEIGFRIGAATIPGFGQYSVNRGAFTGNSGISTTYAWQSNTGGTTTISTSPNTTTCVVYCHGAWNGAVANGLKTNVNWVGGNAEVNGCDKCHGSSNARLPRPDVLTGAHARHSGNAANSLDLACAKCHPTYTTNQHVDGKVAWDLTNIASSARYRGVTIGAIDTPAPSAVYGQCTNLYCHSSAQSGATGTGSPVYAPVTWGGAILACSGCHGSPMTSGSHSKHGAQYICAVCHLNSGDAAIAKHANGSIDIAFSSLYGGSYSKGAAKLPQSGYGTCSANYCHGTATIAWGGGLADGAECDSCHGGNAAAATNNGSFGTITTAAHKLHVKNTAVLGTNYACARCHSLTVSLANDRLITGTGHLNRSKDIEFALDNGTWNGNSCASTNCHGSKTPSWTATATNADPCTKCHGTPTAGSAAEKFKAPTTGSHQAHLQASHAYGSVVLCRECHTVPLVANESGHLNGIADVAMNGTITRTDGVLSSYSSATSTCITYCHGKTLSSPRPNPAWNVPFLTGTADNDCAKCHGYPPLTTIHTGMNKTSCVTCHNNVSSTGTSFSTPAKHVDGKIDVNHVPYFKHKSDAGSAPFPSCVNFRCHANTSSDKVYPATLGTAPNCQGCHTKSSPGNNCGSCHGALGAADGRPNSTPVAAFPDIVGRHFDFHGSFACSSCHDVYGSPRDDHGPSLRTTHSASSLHIVFTGEGEGMTFNNSNKTCTGACHGWIHTYKHWY